MLEVEGFADAAPTREKAVTRLIHSLLVVGSQTSRKNGFPTGRRDVRWGNQVVHAEVVDQAICSGEVAANFPFLVARIFLH